MFFYDNRFLYFNGFVSLILLGYFFKFTEIVLFNSVVLSYAIAALVLLGFKYSKKKIFQFLMIILTSTVFMLMVYSFNALSDSGAGYKYILTFLCISLFCMSFFNLENNFKIVLPFKFFIFLSYFIVFFSTFTLIFSGKHYSFFLGKEYANSYLVLADLIAIYCLSYFLSFSGLSRYFLIILGVYLILILGSRSTMVFFAFSCGISILFEFQKFGFIKRVFYCFIVFLSCVFFVIYINNNIDYFYRLVSLGDLDNDFSYLSRLRLREDFISNLENPYCFIFGCGASDSGEYTHDLMSVWQYFSIFVFVFNIFLIFIAGFLVVLKKNFYFIIPLFSFCLLQSVFSRSWVSVTYPLLIGICIYVCLDYFSRNNSILISDDSIK